MESKWGKTKRAVEGFAHDLFIATPEIIPEDGAELTEYVKAPQATTVDIVLVIAILCAVFAAGLSVLSRWEIGVNAGVSLYTLLILSFIALKD